MPILSVIIPARNELYLQKTIDGLLSNAAGDVEVIVILDGYWPDPDLKADPRLIVVHREKRGMRASINAGVDIARGNRGREGKDQRYEEQRLHDDLSLEGVPAHSRHVL